MCIPKEEKKKDNEKQTHEENSNEENSKSPFMKRTTARACDITYNSHVSVELVRAFPIRVGQSGSGVIRCIDIAAARKRCGWVCGIVIRKQEETDDDCDPRHSQDLFTLRNLRTLVVMGGQDPRKGFACAGSVWPYTSTESPSFAKLQ